MAYGPMKKIPSRNISYLEEHFQRMEKAVKEMRIALDARNAMKFVDEFGALQWQERSILAGCKQLMEILGFTEEDLMAKPLDEYK